MPKFRILMRSKRKRRRLIERSSLDRALEARFCNRKCSTARARIDPSATCLGLLHTVDIVGFVSPLCPRCPQNIQDQRRWNEVVCVNVNKKWRSHLWYGRCRCRHAAVNLYVQSTMGCNNLLHIITLLSVWTESASLTSQTALIFPSSPDISIDLATFDEGVNFSSLCELLP